MTNPSPTKIRMFTREVWVVSEWKDGAVFKREYVGLVMAFMSDLPFKPGSGAALVPITNKEHTS